MRFNQPREYLLVDFEERINDFMSYFRSLSTPRDLRMIRDRNSFEFVLEKVFSKDPSLRYWVSNIGSGVVDSFFESHYIQDIIDRNERSRIISNPTIEERKMVRRRIAKIRSDINVTTVDQKKKFLKGYVKEKPVRVVKLKVKVRGKEQIRFRDLRTGRFASQQKSVRSDKTKR